ncbi:MAG: hypothetical protein U0R69_10475 [Gaiellales bacterium]
MSRRLGAVAGVARRLDRSLTIRAIATLGLVFAAYVALHERFAAFDAMLARAVLGTIGFETSGAGTTLTVQAGGEFDVYAVVTGSCSSAAGALAVGAVALVLLPGRAWRRFVGALLGAAAFVALNVARICSIVLLGWWLATADRSLALGTVLAPAAVGLCIAFAPRLGPLPRVAALLASGLFGVLAYDVARGLDYSHGMSAYHALAGPVITFGSLAAAIVVLWRLVAGSGRAVGTPLVDV